MLSEKRADSLNLIILQVNMYLMCQIELKLEN